MVMQVGLSALADIAATGTPDGPGAPTSEHAPPPSPRMLRWTGCARACRTRRGRRRCAPKYRDVTLLTLRAGVRTTAISLVIAYPVAHWLARHAKRFRLTLLMLLVLPRWTSYLVRTFAWLLIPGRNGIANAGMQATGAIDAPLLEVAWDLGAAHSLLRGATAAADGALLARVALSARPAAFSRSR